MAVSRNYSSVAQPTTLTGNISAGATSVGVNSPTGFPAAPFTAALDFGTAAEELVEVTSASLGTWAVTRGIDGTSAQSHSIGAVVRHVTSARDSADSRAHEAATAAVHGVSGTLVGTSDTQTLANKTFTNPTINSAALSGTFTGNPTLSGNVTIGGTAALSGGGSLAGTFSGSPTLSGNPTFSGAPAFTGGTLLQRSTAAGLAARAVVAADTQDRYQLQADGKQLWGTGAATPDTNLYRGGVGVLKTDSGLTVAPSGANGVLLVNATSGAFTGKLADLQLAGVSKFSVDQTGAVTAGNMTLGGWGSWTPTWTTSTGAHLPAFGNAAIQGIYAKFGRMLVFSLAITFGSSTNFGSGAGTSDNWILSMPGGFTPSANFADTGLPCGSGRISQSNPVAMPVIVRATTTGATGLMLDTAGGEAGGGVPAQNGTLDSLTPWTWASGNTLAIFGMLETTV